MSTETQIELDRINQSVASAYTALAALGADMPGTQNVDNLAKTAGTAKAVLYSPQTLTEAQKAQARENVGAVSKTGLTLGRDESGLLYIYVDGVSVGTGIELPSGGIDGYITADNQIVFNNLPDGEYTLAYVDEDGTIVPIGAMEKDTNVYYTVTNSLTNCTSSNSATQAIGGQSYSATITANSGYELKSVAVTMGGQSVSVSGGVINIASVTGDIVITAVAEEAAVEIINWIKEVGYVSGKRISLSSGTEKDATGYYLTGFIPVKIGQTVRIKGIGVTDNSNIAITAFKGDKTGNFGTASNCGTTLYNAFVSKGTESNGVYACTLNTSIYPPFDANMEYIRITSNSITADSVITVDKEIV